MIAHYWAWVGGNIGAMPLEGVIATVAGFLLRNPLGRLLGLDAIKAARKDAAAARRIAADLFEHHAGHPHPDAPPEEAK